MKSGNEVLPPLLKGGGPPTTVEGFTPQSPAVTAFSPKTGTLLSALPTFPLTGEFPQREPYPYPTFSAASESLSRLRRQLPLTREPMPIRNSAEYPENTKESNILERADKMY